MTKKASVYLAQLCCSYKTDREEGNGREGRAEKAFKKELHLNVFIFEMHAIKLPSSSQDKKKVFSIFIPQGIQNPIHNNFGLLKNHLLTTVLHTGTSKAISELCSMQKLPQKKENFPL